MTLPRHDLVVLAGGKARRMGGTDKAEVSVGGRRLLDRVLAAAPDAELRIVVGPMRPTVDRQVIWCREHPVGGGPVAAIAAARPRLGAPYVVVLAVDLPFVDSAVVARLLTAAVGRDGAVGVDLSGRDQPLLAAYDVAALQRAMEELEPVEGASMLSLMHRLDVERVGVAEAATDCDTWADVAAAEAVLSVGSDAQPAGGGAS